MYIGRTLSLIPFYPPLLKHNVMRVRANSGHDYEEQVRRKYCDIIKSPTKDQQSDPYVVDSNVFTACDSIASKSGTNCTAYLQIAETVFRANIC